MIQSIETTDITIFSKESKSLCDFSIRVNQFYSVISVIAQFSRLILYSTVPADDSTDDFNAKNY